MKYSDKNLLSIYDQLPDLLAIIWERQKQTSDPKYDVYTKQDALARESELVNKSCIWSMPYRHIYTCNICGSTSTEIKNRLVNPMIMIDTAKQSIIILECELHEIRSQNKVFPESLKFFLNAIK